MSKLGQVVESVEKYNKFVLDQVKRARIDEKFGRDLLGRWNDIKAKIPVSRAPTGLELPRLALPEIDEPGEIARYLFGEGLPGEFPFLNGAYREMYLEPVREIEEGSFRKNGRAKIGGSKVGKMDKKVPQAEEPTRLFSGFMLAEDTNERFHYLTAHQRTHRLSTRTLSASSVLSEGWWTSVSTTVLSSRSFRPRVTFRVRASSVTRSSNRWSVAGSIRFAQRSKVVSSGTGAR